MCTRNHYTARVHQKILKGKIWENLKNGKYGETWLWGEHSTAFPHTLFSHPPRLTMMRMMRMMRIMRMMRTLMRTMIFFYWTMTRIMRMMVEILNIFIITIILRKYQSVDCWGFSHIIAISIANIINVNMINLISIFNLTKTIIKQLTGCAESWDGRWSS